MHDMEDYDPTSERADIRKDGSSKAFGVGMSAVLVSAVLIAFYAFDKPDMMAILHHVGL